MNPPRHSSMRLLALLVLICLALALPFCAADAPATERWPGASSPVTETGEGATSVVSEPKAECGNATITLEALTDRWLNKEPCGAPCWEGLNPGETPLAQVADELAALPYAHVRAGGRTISFCLEEETSDKETLEVWIREFERRNVLVGTITIGVDDAITLGEVVAAYGDPSHVVLFMGHDPHTGEPSGWSANILWETDGLRLHTVGVQWEISFSPRTPITFMTFYAPGSNTWLDNESEDFSAQSWIGYGTYIHPGSEDEP